MGVDNIRVEPSIVTYGSDTAQVQKIICAADVSSSLQSKYFFIHAANGTKGYVWFNVATAGVDPAPAGYTEIAEIALSANTSAGTVAAAVQTGIDTHAQFTATVSGAVVTVTDVTEGYAPAAHDPATNGSGFGFSVEVLGDLAEALGCLDGDIEVKFTQEKIDVTCHESGATKVATFVGGLSEASVTCSMLETTFEKLKKILVKTQGSMIPVGTGATEVLGVGTAKDFENLFKVAGLLNIHPKRKLSGDKSLDITAWKAVPTMEGITLSGTGPVTLPITFMCYPDSTKHKAANILCFGDYTQAIVGG